ncbi:putative small secreted protein [Paucibacter oligotrophus]|uniref:Putative small secreted protein n=1 Tax=Roseateles oligotrophus TaxID=1769250 RepID=A0A840LBQ3_9BURK|nr:entericidin A/B family lipoprotein [Roseateles oligotrophus]MBB4844082.1 putative small secreted protein [Roseateles oligotrophus]
MKKKLLLCVLGLALLAPLVGCNTVNGFGRDLQKVGEKIEDSTKKK